MPSDYEVHLPSDVESKMFAEITRELKTMKWPTQNPHKQKTRRNILMEGVENINAFALGKVRRYDLPYQLVDSQYNERYKDLLKKLKLLMKTHDPDFKYNSIQLNSNVITKPHYDRNNVGRSYCLALGTFEGGGLSLYEGEGDAPKEVVRNKRKWVLYDGKNTKHGSAPVTSGTRFAIIFYKLIPTSSKSRTSPRRVEKRSGRKGHTRGCSPSPCR